MGKLKIRQPVLINGVEIPADVASLTDLEDYVTETSVSGILTLIDTPAAYSSASVDIAAVLVAAGLMAEET